MPVPAWPSRVQYWYCPDVVEQATQTLDALAAIQVAARRWFFWRLLLAALVKVRMSRAENERLPKRARDLPWAP